MDREALAASVVALAFAVAAWYYTIDWIGFRQYPSLSKGLAAAAIVLIAAAMLVAIFDGRSQARYRKELKRLRDERPEAVVSDYAGPEGDGTLLEDAQGRVLLLSPVGGIGEPRVVALPSVEPPGPS